MNKKHFFISIIFFGMLIFVFFVFEKGRSQKSVSFEEDIFISGNSDEHGCKNSVGYVWCEEKNKCLRAGEESCSGSQKTDGNCVVENCHGLEIKCGSNPPEVCAMMYALGDKCLKYAKCAIENGNCRQIQNPEFLNCKACVENCMKKSGNDNLKAFECESECQ